MKKTDTLFIGFILGLLVIKGFQGVFSIFFYTKKMLVKFTNIKKYRAVFLCETGKRSLFNSNNNIM
ncbi:hypothetical protein B1P87_09160 [Enterococcus faecium]|nr:hypothetical protein B1P87_09160 [Enterococcus faecium]